jgi:hypothetical protein
LIGIMLLDTMFSDLKNPNANISRVAVRVAGHRGLRWVVCASVVRAWVYQVLKDARLHSKKGLANRYAERDGGPSRAHDIS